MKLGLIVSMYDEEASVVRSLKRVGDLFARVVVIQSDLTPYPSIQEQIDKLPDAQYVLFPNTDTRTEEQRASTTERFDYIAQGQRRNISEGFRLMEQTDVTHVVSILGDTLLLHIYGIKNIIHCMGTAQVACSRAMGQDFHRATLTREEMADPDNPKGGRLQDHTNKDFMPHLFVVTANVIPRLTNIQLTNGWCFEQCLGDAIGDAKQYVFSEEAYGFSDGVLYNTPSPTNWKH